MRCSFTNQSEHVVFVAVCHTASGTLAPSGVTEGTTATTSIAANGLPAGITEAELCGVTSARYAGLAHGEKNYEVDVGSDAHP